MNQYKKIMIFLMIVTLFFSATVTQADLININKNMSLGKIDVLKNGENNAKWTLIFYNCCDRNHTSYENKYLLNDLKKIGSTNDLNIIAMVDGEHNDDTSIYYIEQYNPICINENLEWPDEADLSNPVVLKSFLKTVIISYPADNYACIMLSDAGSGWQGILHDDQSPLMSIPDFACVFEKLYDETGKKIDILALRPCVMGMFEVAYELKDGVGFLVASEEHMLEPLDKGPRYIFPYFKATWNLKNNTDINPEDFAKSIVNLFTPTDLPLWVFYTYEIIYKKGNINPFLKTISNVLTKFLNNRNNPDFHIVSLYTTLSATNLSRIENVAEKIDILSEKLILYSEDEDTIESINYARDNAREYGKFYPKTNDFIVTKLAMTFSMEKFAFNSFIDLYSFVDSVNELSEENTLKQACKNVKNELDHAIIANSKMSDDSSYGLSIYFPERFDLYNRFIWTSEMPCLYEETSFSEDTNWDEFLRNYLKA